MFINFLIFGIFTSFVDAQLGYGPRLCPYPTLENGRPRLRQRWKMVRFTCSLGYELVGNRYATCRNGEWDVPIPVCVKSGCEIPNVEKGIVILAHEDAWLHAFCLPGYTLKGSSSLYCNGIIWNGTTPECVASKVKPQLSCNFEEPDLCGWTQDEFHDFDWKRLNKKTPSSFLYTGPSYDHTYGPNSVSGYYMYIESTAKTENETARLLSPIYDADVASDACFVFYYHMFGSDTGGLRVYQKPDVGYNTTVDGPGNQLLFQLWGNQGNFWYGFVAPLKNLSEPFQIVIEGVRGTGFASDIAIDDVAIMKGENCTEALKHVVVPTTPAPTSCVGRCNLTVTYYSAVRHLPGCSCNIMCIYDDDCCPDFLEQCVYNFANSKQDDDTTPDSNTTPELPQTQKLVGVNITRASTTTTTVASTVTQTSPARWRTKYESSTGSGYTFGKRKTQQTVTLVPFTKAVTKAITTSTTASTTSTTSTTTTPKPTSPVTTSTTTTTTPVSTTTTSTIQTTKMTPAISTTTTTKKPVTTKVSSTVYYKKDAISEVTVPRNATSSKIVEEIAKKSNWGGAMSILISAICIGCFCGLVYAVVALRSSRGRLYLARIRGSATQDPEVRYLNTDVDIDD